jgi:hypothetical protein
MESFRLPLNGPFAVSNAIALQPEPASQATSVFVVFLVAQVLDGLLTYWGVSLLGVGVEANALIATAIEAIGAERALLSAKLLACVCGYILYRTSYHRPLAIAAGLYLGVAVIPWLLVAGTVLSSR